MLQKYLLNKEIPKTEMILIAFLCFKDKKKYICLKRTVQYKTYDDNNIFDSDIEGKMGTQVV
jgi:hypothetical protein